MLVEGAEPEAGCAEKPEAAISAWCGERREEELGSEETEVSERRLVQMRISRRAPHEKPRTGPLGLTHPPQVWACVALSTSLSGSLLGELLSWLAVWVARLETRLERRAAVAGDTPVPSPRLLEVQDQTTGSGVLARRWKTDSSISERLPIA